MILRWVLCLGIACSLAGCASSAKKKAAAAAQAAQQPSMDDMAGDVTFQSFIGILRKAVAARDMNTIASMMTPDFGYRLDPVGEGNGVFQYWDQENIWPELQQVLAKQFVPKGNFMVAPPEFATDPDFHGYRAGLTSVDGVWKFAYFVTDSH